MAQKKKPKKTSWVKIALLYIFVPIIIWFLAFVAWLYWDDIAKLFSKDSSRERNVPRASRKLENPDKSTAPSRRPQEKILDDDRKTLEDILKQRQ
jgi:hypothetical protein